ncbi:MAG: aryl-sulfate sulfotransferase, partial [Bacteroidota bacterium]
MKFLKLLALFFFGMVIYSCSDDEGPNRETGGPIIESNRIESFSVQLNPTGYAPLTALLRLETTNSVSVELSVIGRNGNASSITKRSDGTGTVFDLEILGLYADYDNQVEINLLDRSGNILETQTIGIQTGPLLAEMPRITINVPSNADTPILNFVNYFGFVDINDFRPQRPFIFDQFGDIRWYLDFSSHPILFDLFYDNGMTRLQNGNLLFGDERTGSIYEIDMLGRIADSWSLQGNGFHHHVIEKPDGNLLVTINDASKSTVEDVIIEIDRNSGQFTNTWDLNGSLDNSRRAWPTDLADLEVDWFHANAVEYSA